MYKILTVLLFALSLVSCEKALKNVEDYYPKVEMTGAKIQADGSVLVEGRIISEGAAELEILGFSYDTHADHPLTAGQILTNTLSGDRFSAVYPPEDFELDSVYYFKVFAANAYGYAYADGPSLTGIIATPIDPPCLLPTNSVSIGGGQPTYDFSNVSAPVSGGSLGYWEISATTSSGPTISYKFGSPLTTKVYKTTTNSSPGTGQVFVTFYDGFINGTLQDGTDVYVKTISSGIYEVILCSAPWQYNTSTFYFNSRMISPD